MGETVGYLNTVFIAEVDHHVAAKDHVETWLELVGIRQQIEGFESNLIPKLWRHAHQRLRLVSAAQQITFAQFHRDRLYLVVSVDGLSGGLQATD